MAKVAILVPQQDMEQLVHPLVERYSNLHVMALEHIQTEQVKTVVQDLETQGCELIVARGLQARIIRRIAQLPLVEIRITAQELGMVILELKQQLAAAHPRIGLVGSSNMYCDTAPFDKLFDIELRTYMVEDDAALPRAVEMARQEGCQAIIGGEITCAYARAAGLPHGFVTAGYESIFTALEIADRVGYAIDLEKRNSEEMEIMLSNTFTGIMQVDRDGVIRRVNRAGYDLLERVPGEILGKPVDAVLPGLPSGSVEEVLQEGGEVYALTTNVQRGTLVVNLAPLRMDGEVSGVLLTFQEGQRITQMDSELRRELYRRGYTARFSFDTILCKSAESRENIRLAKRMAKYHSPILLTGENGSGKAMWAQCIHNESLVSKNPYIWVDCSAWLPETLDTMLFGTVSSRKDRPPCMAELAQDGTLYLSHVECLPTEAQYKLYNLIHGCFMHNGSNEPMAANVRVLASSAINLAARVEKGEFRSDLYYELSALSLALPPLRRCREDIIGWVEYYMGEWEKQYKRYIHLTKGAQEFILNYDWPGNLDQLNNICKRIVLLAEKRRVDEVFVRQQLALVTPKILPGTEKVVLYKDEQGVQLAELLRKYGGNRAKVAEELGISKATLWRRIKKYGITQDYCY